MNFLKRYIKRKRDLSELFSLYSRQPWLIEKDKKLGELFKMCGGIEQKKIIIDLLQEFNYLGQQELSDYLNQMADFIINDSGFLEESTQVAAFTYNEEADSSQKILDYIKMPLFRKGWSDLKTSNRYGAVMKNYKKGLNQIVFVDEFVGSGQTVLVRIKQLSNDIKDKFELKFCFIAGMESGIQNIESLGFQVFCPLRLAKGISDKFSPPELESAILNMKELESKLAQQVKDYRLDDYSFGYNAAEALYSLEGCQGNTPNSVFPIFWWPRNLAGNYRETILTRFEKGLK